MDKATDAFLPLRRGCARPRLSFSRVVRAQPDELAMKRQPPPDVPDDLDTPSKHKLVEWVQTEARFDRRYKRFCTPDALRHVVGETLDYHRATGNKSGYRDWLAVVKNRIRALATEGDYFLKRGGRSRYEELELPQERRESQAQGELVGIAPVIDLLTGRKRA